MKVMTILMNNILKKILRYIYSNKISKLEESLIQKKNVCLSLSFLELRLMHLISEILQSEKIWLVFFIDTRTKLFTSSNLNVQIEVKSFFWLNKTKFSFLPQTTQFIPQIEHKRKSFIGFIFREILDHKLLLFFFTILTIVLYYNNDIDLLDKLNTANLTIITIFISIYLVLVALNLDKRREVIDEFYSGVYHIKYEFNKNTFYLAILSITISILSIIIVNYKFSYPVTIHFNLLTLIDKYLAALLLTVFSIFFTYICLFNIINYYVKLVRDKVYNDSINKIVSDQQKLIREKYGKIKK